MVPGACKFLNKQVHLPGRCAYKILAVWAVKCMVAFAASAMRRFDLILNNQIRTAQCTLILRGGGLIQGPCMIAHRCLSDHGHPSRNPSRDPNRNPSRNPTAVTLAVTLAAIAITLAALAAMPAAALLAITLSITGPGPSRTVGCNPSCNLSCDPSRGPAPSCVPLAVTIQC